MKQVISVYDALKRFRDEPFESYGDRVEAHTPPILGGTVHERLSVTITQSFQSDTTQIIIGVVPEFSVNDLLYQMYVADTSLSRESIHDLWGVLCSAFVDVIDRLDHGDDEYAAWMRLSEELELLYELFFDDAHIAKTFPRHRANTIVNRARQHNVPPTSTIPSVELLKYPLENGFIGVHAVEVDGELLVYPSDIQHIYSEMLKPMISEQIRNSNPHIRTMTVKDTTGTVRDVEVASARMYNGIVMAVSHSDNGCVSQIVAKQGHDPLTKWLRQSAKFVEEKVRLSDVADKAEELKDLAKSKGMTTEELIALIKGETA